MTKLKYGVLAATLAVMFSQGAMAAKLVTPVKPVQPGGSTQHPTQTDPIAPPGYKAVPQKERLSYLYDPSEFGFVNKATVPVKVTVSYTAKDRNTEEQTYKELSFRIAASSVAYHHMPLDAYHVTVKVTEDTVQQTGSQVITQKMCTFNNPYLNMQESPEEMQLTFDINGSHNALSMNLVKPGDFDLSNPLHFDLTPAFGGKTGSDCW